jgi:adenylate cyclase
MSETRKHVAILAADVVVHNRFAGEDDDRAVPRVRGLPRDLIDAAAAAHTGRVVKRTGDRVLVEFRNVVDAVRAAIEAQDGMVELNAGLPPQRRVEFRIGIHIGDVVEEIDGDLTGDGVNIAGRLERTAKPGTISLSEDAYRQASGSLDTEVIDLGWQAGVPIQTKTRPALALLGSGIAVLLITIAAGSWYLFSANRPAAVTASAPAPVASNAAVAVEAVYLSMVVLPFTNLSNDPSQDYFSDGITENLTIDLSRIRNSFVIARNTAFTFRGRNIDPKMIGKELGVRYVLEGSVQHDQRRVRVDAHLIDAQSGAQLLADRAEEDVSDLFKLQDQLVERLSNKLGYELVKAKTEKGARSTNSEVIDLFMRGMALFEQQPPTKDNNYLARALFDQALKIEPNNADALTGDAATYLIDYLYGWTSSKTNYDVKVLGQAEQAIALAPDSVFAYWHKGVYLYYSHRSNEALGAANAGLAVNPNFAPLYAIRCSAGASTGHFERAKFDILQALRLSPRDPLIGGWYVQLGDAELGLRNFDAAIGAYHKSIELGFRNFVPYVDLAAAYAVVGKMEEAQAALAEARRLNPKLTVKWLQAVAPNLPPLFEGVRRAGLPEE